MVDCAVGEAAAVREAAAVGPEGGDSVVLGVSEGGEREAS